MKLKLPILVLMLVLGFFVIRDNLAMEKSLAELQESIQEMQVETLKTRLDIMQIEIGLVATCVAIAEEVGDMKLRADMIGHGVAFMDDHDSLLKRYLDGRGEKWEHKEIHKATRSLWKRAMKDAAGKVMWLNTRMRERVTLGCTRINERYFNG